MKRMFRIGTLLLAFLAVSCLKRGAQSPLYPPHAMLERIIEGISEERTLVVVTAKDEEFSRFIGEYYQLDAATVSDGAICYADGADSFEVAVIAFSNESAARAAQQALSAYKDSRATVFDGYAPQQAAIARNGIVAVNGSFVALLICPSPEEARERFLACFASSPSGGDAHAQTAASGGYNPSAILAAWKSGDRSSLDSKNSCILDIAENAISQNVRDDMSDFEKERAIHDWMTAWSTFDSSVFGRSATIKKDSDTPFGFLVDKRAMCHGYSSTFQLFMDMLGIECITVLGTPGGNGMRHSWNQVRLDSEWYCVDVAWDDPIGGRPTHQFFNVTSRTMRNSGIHHWDESSVPEARGTKYSAR